jgi:hypothetical protein
MVYFYKYNCSNVRKGRVPWKSFGRDGRLQAESHLGGTVGKTTPERL